MTHTDPYTPDREYYECRECGSRHVSEERELECEECGGQLRNIAVPRE